MRQPRRAAPEQSMRWSSEAVFRLSSTAQPPRFSAAAASFLNLAAFLGFISTVSNQKISTVVSKGSATISSSLSSSDAEAFSTS